jgi:hypothetical protein
VIAIEVLDFHVDGFHVAEKRNSSDEDLIIYRQSGCLYTEFKFKYLYKSHCKSYEYGTSEEPQQFVGFAVALERRFGKFV